MKNLYYKTTGNPDALARILADGKNNMTIWDAENVANMYDKTGSRTGLAALPAHVDAVPVLADTSAEDIKKAHTLAAMRDTIRTKEEKAAAILAAGIENLSAAERLALLSLVNVAYHSSGKIEEIFSIDSTAACEFCQRMRAAGAENELMICAWCYAAADAWKEAAWRTHKLNALILSTVLFTVDELKNLAIPGRLCRMNEDGDTVNTTMGRNYLRIFAAHPVTCFGYWYKNAPAVAEALQAEGYTDRAALPENVRFIHSSALIGFPAAPTWFDDGIFTVYPDAETTAAAIAAGSWACNGRKCSACGFHCYLMQRQEKPVHIAEILRANKATVARIRAAYDARKAQQGAA